MTTSTMPGSVAWASIWPAGGGCVSRPWTKNPRRFLDHPWFPDDAELLKPYLIAESPASFRRRLIFTELEPLRRATFPAGQEASTDLDAAAAVV